MVIYALVASLESLLTAAAIDKLDPYKRQSNFNRELFAKGFGNIISSLIGGLPIIAEVVRSSANVNDGAKTRWSNFFHGLFLLAFVLLLTRVIDQVPLSALAAILIVTGYRLASPHEFVKTLKLGKEQLIIFIGTIVCTLATDLLLGILAGIVIKLIIHTMNGVPLKYLMRPFFSVEEIAPDKYCIDVKHSAVFSNYLHLRAQIERLPKAKHIVVDLNDTQLVDSTALSGLDDLKNDYEKGGGTFQIIGLEGHHAVTDHPHAVRKKK